MVLISDAADPAARTVLPFRAQAPASPPGTRTGPGECAGLAFEPPPAPDHQRRDRHHHDQIDAQRDEQRHQHGVPAVPAGGGHAGGVTRRASAPMTPLSGRIMAKAAPLLHQGDVKIPVQSTSGHHLARVRIGDRELVIPGIIKGRHSRSCSRTGRSATCWGRLYEPGEVASFEGVIGKELSNPIPPWAEDGAGRGQVPYGVAPDMNTPDPD